MIRFWFPVAAAFGVVLALALAGAASAQTQLTLDDFDDENLDVEFAALLQVAREISGSWTILYQASPHTPAYGSLVEGELGLGPDDVAINRIRQAAGSDGDLQLSDSDTTFHLGDYFTNGGSDLTIYVQTSATEVASTAVSLQGNFGNAARFNLSSDAQTALQNLNSGDRVIIAMARPEADPPAQVTGVSASADDHDSITVEWDAVTDADGYVVEWDTDSAFASPDAAAVSSGATTEYEITGLAENTEYHVRVRATRTGADDGEWSASDQATTDLQPPAQVTGVSASADDHESIAVEWDAAARATGYRVEWDADSAFASPDDATVSSGATTEYEITGLAENTEYSIRVYATRTNADDGLVSNTASATTELQPPAKVTGVSATADDHDSITVEWSAAARADGYRVEWGTTSGTYTDNATTANTSYNITSLSARTEYHVRVVSTRAGADDGTPSEEKSATTEPPQPPGRVTDVSATADDHDSITVRWTAVTDATGYVVQMDDNSSFSTAINATISSGATTSHTVNSLDENTEYHFRVKATKTGASDGDWSIADSATTELQPPAQVTGVSATADSDTAISVEWDTAARATGYLVEWGTSSGSYDDSATSADSPYTINGLSGGTIYHIRVTAQRAGADDGPPSDEASAATQADRPARVTGVSATSGDYDRITVSWSDVAEATAYTVQWKTSTEAWGDHQATAVSSPHTITGLQEDTEYEVRVIAVRTGAEDGEPSSESTVRTALQPPERVTGLNPTVVSDVEISLAWSNALRAGGYIIQWRTASESFDSTRQATATALTYTASDLDPGSRYFFRVIATRPGANDAPPSAEVDATTEPAPTPAQVVGLTATAISDHEVRAEWQPAQHATGYVVQWDTDTAFPDPDQATVSTNGAIIEGLDSETEYFVRVYGTRRGATDGAPSAADSAMTQRAPIKDWIDRVPGGAVAAQLALAAFAGLMAGVRVRTDKTPRREAMIVVAMCAGSLILPGLGMGNIFWTGGIALLVALAAGAVIFLTSRR